MVKKYWVVTPQYMTYGSSAGMGFSIDPPEYGSDVVEVEAMTKREAKILGVRELRRIESKWMADQASDMASPFTGLKVYDETEGTTDDF